MNTERELLKWLKEHFPKVLEKWEKRKKQFLSEHYQERFDKIREWFDNGANIPEEIKKAVEMILKMQKQNPESSLEYRRMIMQLCRGLEGWPYTR